MIEFLNPVVDFGGYWSHSTIGVNMFTVDFFDAGGALIGSDIGVVNDPTGNLHWFGWTSTTPIKRVEINGRFPVNDYLQANVPAPGSLALFGAAMLVATRRRR